MKTLFWLLVLGFLWYHGILGAAVMGLGSIIVSLGAILI